MKKILIMVGTYYPKPLANGICTHQIALALQKKGYEIHIICIGSDEFQEDIIKDGFFIYPVKPRLFHKLRALGEKDIDSKKGKIYYNIAMMLNKIKKLIFIGFYPMTSPLFIWRYYNLGHKLHKEQGFDAVLSVYNPLEAIVAGSLLKKRYKDLKLIHYFLDSLTNDGGVKYLPRKWTSSLGFKWEKRIYSNADKILKMRCHEQHYSKEIYDNYRHKIMMTDIPLYIKISNKDNIIANQQESKLLNWIYTGSLSSGTYDAEYACLLFSKIVEKDNNYRFNFYSRGNFEKRIQEYSIKTSNAIVRHGFVESNIVRQAILNADILISVGTLNSSMIPSKIFEYMSSGKPIIHFYKQDGDVCIPYYEKYPLSLCIKEDYKNIDENIIKINTFMNDIQSKMVEQNELDKYFVENTPEYTADIIDKEIM